MEDRLDSREISPKDLPSRFPEGGVTSYFTQFQENRNIFPEALAVLRNQFDGTTLGMIIHEFMPNRSLSASKLMQVIDEVLADNGATLYYPETKPSPLQDQKTISRSVIARQLVINTIPEIDPDSSKRGLVYVAAGVPEDEIIVKQQREEVVNSCPDPASNKKLGTTPWTEEKDKPKRVITKIKQFTVLKNIDGQWKNVGTICFEIAAFIKTDGICSLKYLDEVGHVMITNPRSTTYFNRIPESMYGQDQITAQRGKKISSWWHKEDSKSGYIDSKVEDKDTLIYMGQTSRDKTFGATRSLHNLIEDSILGMSPEQRNRMAMRAEDEDERVEWEKENCW